MTPEELEALPLPLPAEAEGLIRAGLAYPGVHVFDGNLHPLLQKLATEHAKYQARVSKLGHQGFNSRFQAIYKALSMSAAEIAAMSWSWQKDASMLELGEEMFKSWRGSSGHWRIASKPHDVFGASMAKDARGTWYSCVLVADGGAREA